MYPTISFLGTTISTYNLCVGIALAVLLFGILLKLKRSRLIDSEAYYILPKLLIALISALAGAIIMDAVLKIRQNGGFKLSGLTFYGGLIFGIVTLGLLLLIFRKSKLSAMQWLDFLIVPFILFHCIGRVGCFFAGCCYGKETHSHIGVVFPDQPEAGIFHNGVAVYPTQLFEAGGLLLLAIIIHFLPSRKFIAYCYGYPIMRIIIEMFRGDNRGVFIGSLSPAQFTSVMIISVTTISIICYFFIKKYKKKIV